MSPLCSKIVSHYFKSGMMGTVLSINYGLYTFIDAGNCYVGPKITHKYSISAYLMISVGLFVMGLIASLVILMMDKKVEKLE